MKYQEFKNALNKPYFTNLDILLKKLNVYNYQLSLWQKRGYLARLKKGMYFFVEKRAEISAQEISFLIYQPSYLSMETMLSYYGLIPEMVHAQTCVTTKTTRKFSNDFGVFTFRHIKSELFFGYNPIETKFGKYLIAQPEKALLDYFYFNLGKLNNQADLEELRINSSELKRIIDRKKIEQYLEEFKIEKLTKIVHKLFEIC